MIVARRRSVKKVFLKILQNSQESACARVSFFKKIAGLRRNFAKDLRTPLFIEHLRSLLLDEDMLWFSLIVFDIQSLLFLVIFKNIIFSSFLSSCFLNAQLIFQKSCSEIPEIRLMDFSNSRQTRLPRA